MPVPVVYIDVVWLVNFAMDAVILWTTCWAMRRTVRPVRLLLAALFGSGYALLLFVPSLSLLTTWTGKALASLWMVGLGIPWRNWLDLLRLVLSFYFVTFVFAGAAVALHFALPGVSVASGLELAGGRLAFATSLQSLGLIVAVVVGVGLVRFTFVRVRRAQFASQQVVSVRAGVDGKEVRFRGLVDSGNQLRDPVSRRPVCLVDAGVLAPLLPEPLARAIADKPDMLAALSALPTGDWARRVAVVPYRGAGGQQHLTFAIRPDFVQVDVHGIWRPAAVAVLLAAHTERLSTEGKFQAILHTEVIARDDAIETDDTAGCETENSTAAAMGSGPAETRGRP